MDNTSTFIQSIFKFVDMAAGRVFETSDLRACHATCFALSSSVFLPSMLVTITVVGVRSYLLDN